MDNPAINDIELKMFEPQIVSEKVEKDNCVGTDGRTQVTENCPSIHANQLHEFVEILKHDDVEAFLSWPEYKQNMYLRGKFNYDSCDASKHESISRVFQIPFNLAAGYCALEIVKEFMKKGMDMRRLDVKESNVLHVVAIAATMHREMEEDFILLTETLLDAMPIEVLVQLCNHENHEGLRPLELSALLGSFAVYNCLIEREGYMKGGADLMGLSTVHNYDISDYEPGGGLTRLIRNPLKLMIFVERDGFDSLKKFGSLQLPVIRQWTYHQLRRYLPFLLIWWIYRLLYLGAISYLDPAVVLYTQMCTNHPKTFNKGDHDSMMSYRQCSKFGNYSEKDRQIGMGLNRVIEIWSYIMVVVDLLEVIICFVHLDRRRAYRRLYLRSFSSYTLSYRLSTFGLYIIAVLAPKIGALYQGGVAFRHLILIKAFQLPLILYSFLHIIEFMPVLGIFAITIQKMTKTLAIFLIFLLPVKCLFSQFFHFFASDEGFSDFKQGVYLLFMMDMGSFDFGTTPDLAIKLVHVFYFLVMVILLFNYLIAVLSIVANQTAEDRKQLLKLRRLQMVGEIEERVGYWFWWMVRKITRDNNKTYLVA